MHGHGQSYDVTSTAVKDPVCGMAVSPDSPHRTDHAGVAYAFCCAGCLATFRSDPDRYLTGAVAGEAASDAIPPRPAPSVQRRVHVPHAPGSPVRAGHLSEVRHGTRAAFSGPRGGRRKSRARGDDTAILDQRGPRRTTSDPHHGDPHFRGVARGAGLRLRPQLGRAGAGHADRALGRVAVLRARLAVDRHPEPEHVHAHCPRRGRGVPLQSRGGTRAGHLPGFLPKRGRDDWSLFRGGRSHRHARAAGAGAGATRAQPYGRGN